MQPILDWPVAAVLKSSPLPSTVPAATFSSGGVRERRCLCTSAQSTWRDRDRAAMNSSTLRGTPLEHFEPVEDSSHVRAYEGKTTEEECDILCAALTALCLLAVVLPSFLLAHSPILSIPSHLGWITTVRLARRIQESRRYGHCASARCGDPRLGIKGAGTRDLANGAKMSEAPSL